MCPWNSIDLPSILSLVHRDPLKRIKALVKLECFSDSGFNRLKELVSQVVPSVRRDKRPSKRDKISRKEVVRYQIEDSLKRCDFSQMDMRGKRHWWKRMSWDSVVDPDNLWGDLSYEAEAALKSLLRG